MNTKTKTPGQIAFEEYYKGGSQPWLWEKSPYKHKWEAAALAVLASQWRPVTEPPEDVEQVVIVSTKGEPSRGTGVVQFVGKVNERTHWMPIPPLPHEPIDPYAELKATKQELDRKDFEEWAFNAGYGCSSQQIRDTLFIGWQAARKQQEGK